MFRLIEKAGVFTNWVTSNLEQARLDMLQDKEGPKVGELSAGEGHAGPVEEQESAKESPKVGISILFVLPSIFWFWI